MLTNKFAELTLPRLGFGAMRMPQNADGTLDEQAIFDMVDYAMSHGVNYFDTAWPYHGGLSEKVIAKALKRYPRESYFLATKYPGHQIASSYDPAAIFEKQLEKCAVDYFDFYLLHNVNEGSIGVYTDPKWNILPYFIEQKKAGRIKHLGFSSHGGLDNMRKFLDFAGESMEFCQIQLNYIDWTLQDAKKKYDLLTERNIPVWVMEPVRGGKLASLPEDAENKLKALRPDVSPAEWAFRFIQRLPNVKVILSGMSNMEQMTENIRTFEKEIRFSDRELYTLFAVAESMKSNVPCTACRYCVDTCPAGLDIPMLLATINELHFQQSINISMRLEALPEDKLPSACLACGQCVKLCPQSIDIPAALAELAEKSKTLPNWAEICRQRDEDAKKNS